MVAIDYTLSFEIVFFPAITQLGLFILVGMCVVTPWGDYLWLRNLFCQGACVTLEWNVCTCDSNVTHIPWCTCVSLRHTCCSWEASVGEENEGRNWEEEWERLEVCDCSPTESNLAVFGFLCSKYFEICVYKIANCDQTVLLAQLWITCPNNNRW